MINHPVISRQIAAARRHDLLAAAAHARLAREAIADRRPAHRRHAPGRDTSTLSARPAQARCAGC